MAKIDRYNGNLEAPASAALGTERTIFGTGSQSDDLTDQFNAFLLRGWGIVGPSDQPTLQDFNAMGFTLGQIHAYLHQMGVAEYNSAQEYHTGSFTNLAGVLYVSLVDDNVGNDPASSPAQWSEQYQKGADDLIQAGEPLYVTSTQTVTFPAGIRAILVELVGGGGAGGGLTGDGANTAGGGGGGSGGFARNLIMSGFGLSQLCTIGAGGAGAAGASGGNGGTTSFGSLLSATGGSGGSAITPGATLTMVAGGAGGAGTGGEFASSGAQGGIGYCFGATSTNRGPSGHGGASLFGAGAPAIVGTGATDTNGASATSPGSGGGGAHVGSSFTSVRTGGAGAAGVIKLTYFV